MKNDVFAGCLAALVIWAGVAVISGVIVSFVWGLFIPYIFPAQVAAGYIPAQLGVGQAIALSILAALIFPKSTSKS